jgi:hypothetical protein
MEFKYYYTGFSFYGYDPTISDYRLFDGYDDYKEFIEEIEG